MSDFKSELKFSDDRVVSIDFRSLQQQVESLSNYLVMCDGSCVLKEIVNIATAIAYLEKTYAISFALNVLKQCDTIPHGQVMDNVYATQNKYMRYVLNQINLYRKETVLPLLMKVGSKTVSEFKNIWQNSVFSDDRSLELFYIK